MTSWNDFNDAEDQNDFSPIPKGTLVKVRMTIKPGGYNDLSRGWLDGYATFSESGAIYLNCEFVVVAGQYAKRKFWSLIGLHSTKGEKWGNMGRTLIKGILNSARGLKKDDNSPQALQARSIKGFSELDGIEFVARVGMDKDMYDEDKNVLSSAVTPDHKDYAAVMQVATNAPQNSYAPAQQAAYNPHQQPAQQPIQQQPQQAPTQSTQQQTPTQTGTKPAWAQ